MSNIQFTDLDFDRIKIALRRYLEGQSKFKDYDFEGSNMSVLLDVLAYNTFQNNFYTNMAISEMFLDSAQLKDSVISHAKELNYLPSSRKSSQAYLDVTLNVTDEAPVVTIPRNTRFLAQCGTTTYNFITDEAVDVFPAEGIWKYTGLPVFEGTAKTEVYRVTNDTSIRFVINDPNVDLNSLRVTVRTNANADSAATEYLFKQNLFGVSANDPVFYVQPYPGDRYEVVFGQNAFGNQPINGNVIVLEYRSTSGEEANGANLFTTSSLISGYSAIVQTTRDSSGALTRSEGGAERETLESIKYFAPKSIQIQDRAVTENDYEIILRNRFPEIQAVSVYGGEELDPPRYGRVVIAVDVNNADGVSDSNKVKYENYLRERCPIGIEPIVVSPNFLFLSVSSKVNYNVNQTNKTTSDIRTAVRSAISNYSVENLSDFKVTFRYSKFSTAIDNADASILSNLTEVLGIIPLSPLVGETINTVINFRNELYLDPPLTTDEVIATHQPAVRSSVFTYNGTPNCYLRDDGNGVLQVIRNNNDTFIYLNRNVGTVDYTTGRIVIRNLKVDSYTGSEIKLFCKPKNRDISAPKDRIITIREEDISVEVTGVRQ